MIETTHNTLLQKMLLDLPGTGADFERIHIEPGPWPTDLPHHMDWAYFPDDSLVGLSPNRPAWGDATMAVVGHRGFWFPDMLTGAQLQAQVLRGGHMHRMDWSIVRRDPRRYAPRLVTAAEASQRLIRQMTQMAFCASHHTAMQRRASWLLVCLHQAVQTSLPIRLVDTARTHCEPDDVFQRALGVLEAHLGIWRGADLPTGLDHNGMPASLLTLDTTQLNELACTCHCRINGQASA